VFECRILIHAHDIKILMANIVFNEFLDCIYYSFKSLFLVNLYFHLLQFLT